MAHILKSSKDCSGCTACAAGCPVDAIRMKEDMEGFMIPSVDEDKCIECSSCLKICPENVHPSISEERKTAYAFQNKDEMILSHSSSGAFFPAIAEYILDIGGYICGCVLNEKLLPEHSVTYSFKDIRRMQDSKYVQSNVKTCFSEIIDLLKQGEKVLFTGTSCQIAGLKKILDNKKIDGSKLLCVDFFCHGVPSPLIWEEFLNLYRNETKKEIIDFRFRNKKYGWGKKSRGTYHLNTVIRKKAFIKKDDISLLGRMWYYIFFSNLCLRRYCYNCPYTSINKPSDITMADFWGIEELCENCNDGKGYSLVIAHNEKGRQIIESLTKAAKIYEFPVDSAIKRQGNAFKPSKEPEQRNQFWADYYELGFKEVVKKYYRYDFVHRIKDFIHRILFEFHLTNLYK